MIETILNIYKTFNETILSNPLSTIGLLLVVSFLGSKIFQRFGIPQVVGFIVLGVLHGPSFLNVVPLEVSQELLLISEIALGLIGFDMGGHLHLNEIRKLGKSILFIINFRGFWGIFPGNSWRICADPILVHRPDFWRTIIRDRTGSHGRCFGRV
jgi:hypothetical protein